MDCRNTFKNTWSCRTRMNADDKSLLYFLSWPLPNIKCLLLVAQCTFISGRKAILYVPPLPTSLKNNPSISASKIYWPKEIPSQQPAFKVYWQPLDYRNCSFVKNFLKVLKIYLLNLKKVSILLAQDWIMTKATWQEKRDTVELHNSVGGPWVCRILISIFFSVE